MNYKKKIFLLFSILFGAILFIPFDTFALTQNWAPYDIVIQTYQFNNGQQQNINTVVNPPAYYSDNTLGHYYSWGEQYNSFPLPASVYFRYNNANNNLCGSNYGNVSGQFYALQSFNTYTYEVQAENRNTKQRFGCSTTPNGHYMTFVCSGLDLTQNYNFVLNNLPRVQRYGIGERFEIYCINDTSSIITNNNYNTDRIIENNNNNTNRLLDSQTETNDILKDDNTSSSQTQASGYFTNFSSNSHGLSGIITAPLRLLNSFTTEACYPLEFDLPIVHNHIALPCVRPIIEQYFGPFFSLYQLITTGVICYGVLINLYSKVRQIQNPNNDRIEVLQL